MIKRYAIFCIMVYMFMNNNYIYSTEKVFTINMYKICEHINIKKWLNNLVKNYIYYILFSHSIL